MGLLFKKKSEILDNDLEVTAPVKDYETLLDSVDELTEARLRSIDMSFAVQQERFKDFGVNLTELDCTNEIINIKRNQKGYYADETKSLNSNDDYENYERSLDFYERHEEDFEIINSLLCDKEQILQGCYIVKKGTDEEIEDLINYLGYGLARKKALFESEPDHPSKEYNRLLELMEMIDEPKNREKIIEEVMGIIRSCYNEDVKIEIKRIDDKYDIDLDDSYGLILLNAHNGDKHMLYAVDGFDVIKDTCDKYLVKKNVYLEVYFKLIARCIKMEYTKKSNKKR